jgi:hypothetical protein
LTLNGSPPCGGLYEDGEPALGGLARQVRHRLQNIALAALNLELVAMAEAIDSPRRVVLDMDSTEVPVYGQQEQSVRRVGASVRMKEGETMFTG